MVTDEVAAPLSELLCEPRDRELCMCYLKSGGFLSSAECDGRNYLKVSKVARGKVEPFSEQDRNILMLHLTRSRVEERISDERVSPIGYILPCLILPSKLVWSSIFSKNLTSPFF